MKKRVTCESKNLNFNCKERNALENRHTTDTIYTDKNVSVVSKNKDPITYLQLQVICFCKKKKKISQNLLQVLYHMCVSH